MSSTGLPMSNQSSSPQGSSRQEDQDIQELSRQRGGAAGTPSSEADENPVLVASRSSRSLPLSPCYSRPPGPPVSACHALGLLKHLPYTAASGRDRIYTPGARPWAPVHL